MSDMRDFNSSDDIRPIIVSEDIRPEGNFASDGTLGDFHVIETEEASNTGRTIGALAVALLLGTAGVFAISGIQGARQLLYLASRVAAVTPPAQAPAPPPAQSADTSAPSSSSPDNSAASQPMTPATATAPAKSRSVSRTARANTSSTDIGTSSSSSDADMATPTPTPAVPVPQQSAAGSHVPSNTQRGQQHLGNSSAGPGRRRTRRPMPALTPSSVTPAQLRLQPATTQPDQPNQLQPVRPDQIAPASPLRPRIRLRRVAGEDIAGAALRFIFVPHENVEGGPKLVAEDVALHQYFMLGPGDLDMHCASGMRGGKIVSDALLQTRSCPAPNSSAGVLMACAYPV